MRLKAFQLTAEQKLITDVFNTPQVIYTIRNDSLVVFDNLDRYDLPESFKISNPASITFDEARNLFIGTVRGKILHWDVNRKKMIMEYKPDIATHITDIHYDTLTQYLWTNGFFKFKKGKLQPEQSVLGGSMKQGFSLPDNELIIRAGRDRLYQMYQYDIAQVPKKPFSEIWETTPTTNTKLYVFKDDIFKSPLNTIHYDAKDDKIWMALGNRTMINTRDTVYEFFIKENKPVVSNCFEQSPDGNIWIGTKGGGFVVAKNDKIQLDFRNETYKEYGDIRLIKCAEELVWLLTESDLLVIDYQGKILNQYNTAMSIEANNITDIAVFGNKAWLCSKNGLMSIDFQQQQFGKPPPPILRSVEVQGIAQPEGSYRFPYHKNLQT